MIATGGANAAVVVTFDNPAGDSIRNAVVPSFSNQGLTFTSSGTFMGIWNLSPNSNGTNSNVFAGFDTGDFETITRTGGGNFSLYSFDMTISWYDTNPLEVVTINGSPIVLAQGLNTFNFGTNFENISSVVITGVPSNTGYWSLDNIVYSAVPEPATWAMLILGFFGIGATLRSSRRKVATASA